MTIKHMDRLILACAITMTVATTAIVTCLMFAPTDTARIIVGLQASGSCFVTGFIWALIICGRRTGLKGTDQP